VLFRKIWGFGHVVDSTFHTFCGDNEALFVLVKSPEVEWSSTTTALGESELTRT